MESVLLHPEPAVLNPPPPCPGGHRPPLLEALLRAESSAQREVVVRGWIAAHGFAWLGFGRALASGGRLLPVSFCTSYADPAWIRRYFDQRHHEVDPRLRAVLDSNVPFVWSLPMLAESAAPPLLQGRQRHFVDELRRSGAASGVMLALPAASGLQRFFVSLAARTEGDAWITEAQLGQALLLTHCLHEVHMRHAEAPRPVRTANAPGLTSVQREILARVAHGLPDKQIASQLEMTLHNVDYHMRRLRRHFGVRNRVQLSKVAIGGIGPDASRVAGGEVPGLPPCS
jgi:DNA-binding CsgD family transcriptional regulator